MDAQVQTSVKGSEFLETNVVRTYLVHAHTMAVALYGVSLDS